MVSSPAPSEVVSSPAPSESAVEGTGDRVEAPETTRRALPELAEAGGAPPEPAEAEAEGVPTAGVEKRTREGIVPQAGDGARGLTGARP